MKRMPAADRDALKRKLKHYAATGEGDVVKMVNQSSWRLRHGNWRAIFVVEGNLLVIHIAHRRDIYR